MKIALLSPHTFSQPGGVKNHILGLAKEFKKKNLKVKIIVPRRKIGENYGKEIILLGTSFPLSFGGAISDLSVSFLPLTIERVLSKEKFDVLHFHNFSFPLTWQILNSPLSKKSLKILTFHANLEGSKFLNTFPWILKEFIKFCQKKIDGIIGVNPLNLEYFKEYSGPKTVIPNGIDLEIFNPNVPKIKKYLDGKINILFVGRIEERKGLIFLLKAYKILTQKFSNLRLIIVGKGPLKKELKDWVQREKLKEVIFEGKISDKILPHYYSTCDIFCSPAIFGESFGMVLIEALSCGKPVVAFKIKGYKEVLKGKGEKFLAKVKDWQDLAKKIEILILNPSLRKEMGEWGIKIAEKYSLPKITEKVLSFYKLCLNFKLKCRKK